MSKSILFICLILVCFSFCSKKQTSVAPPFPVLPFNPGVSTDTSYKNYLALGDSYTIGESVPVTDRFPVQAFNQLANAGVRMRDVRIVAKTGWTTANLLDALNQTTFTQPFDLVTLLIGVNNQYQQKDTAQYRNEFTVLLQRSIVYAGANKNKVLVLSIPDYSVTPFVSVSNKPVVADQINRFNAINKQVCDLFEVRYINITEESRKAAIDRSLIAADSLHFSGKAYKVWADSVRRIAQPFLK